MNVLGEAVILAGGLGTRLRSAVADRPKVMAAMDEDGTPFLAYLLKYVANQGVEAAVLSVGYMGEMIQDYFGDRYAGIELRYAWEKVPLGTGGALKNSLGLCAADNVFLLNGDTFFDVDLSELLYQHQIKQSAVTLSVKKMMHPDRYGTLEISDSDKIQAFKEKMPCDIGFVHGGVDCFSRDALKDCTEKAFSLEKDFLEKKVNTIPMYAFSSDSYFIDIGIPTDYEKAKQDFKDMKF